MKLFFAGDVVLNDNTYTDEKLVGVNLYSLISQHDVICCNLEGSIENEKIRPIPKRGPSVKNGKLTPKRLQESGFNMLTLANNHIMDYGIGGLVYSLKILENDFLCIGAGTNIGSVYQLKKIQAGNLQIGFISVAESQFGVCKEKGGGYAWMLSANVFQLFTRANEECDYYFVICHCGAEELNVPLPEVRELYRMYIDLGATAVIGHHPHVIQGSEDYRGKKIFYSLGNFAFDLYGQDMPYNPIGLCLSVEIEKETIKYRPVVTEYKNGKIEICEDTGVFERADEILHADEEYSKQVDAYCVNAYKTYFRKYYALIVGLDIESKENLAKFAQHRFNGDEIIWDDLFIYHNIAIETNRWICERAIRVLAGL